MAPRDHDRKTELALIHLAKRDLGLDDETYRAALMAIGRVTSAAHLDQHGRQQLIRHFESRGWKRAKRRSTKRHPGVPAHSRAALVSKIEAQLVVLTEEWSYADSIAKRMFKVDSVRFCDDQRLPKIVAALYYEIKRRAARKRLQEGKRE